MSVRPMEAAALIAPGHVRVMEVAPPTPGAGQVRVRLEGCGVCGSNLPVWEGREWFQYPLEAGRPGHEGWGRVEALGPGVTGIAEGDRVAFLSRRAFAALDLAAVDALVPLPAALGDRPFPGEALGCAMNVFRRSDIRPDHTVAVVGIGFLGALLVGLAARTGAHVIAISRRETALEAARIMGAAHALPLSDAAGADGGGRSDRIGDLVEGVRTLAGGELCDRVVEAAGVQTTLDVAAALTRVRGRLVIAGYHQDGPRHVDLRMWNWRGLDVVNAHERNPRTCVRGMAAAVEAVAGGKIDPFPLITHDMPLARLSEGFGLLGERPAGFMKVVVRPCPA